MMLNPKSSVPSSLGPAIGARSSSTLFLLLIVSVVCLLSVTPVQRSVVAPMLAVIGAALWTGASLWDKDGKLPFLDAGFFCVVATAIYSIVPLINYLAGGLQFTLLSDLRLYMAHPTPEQIGGFYWRHVVYIVSLAFTYQYFRGKSSLGVGGVRLPNRATRQTILILFSLCIAYLLILQAFTGFTFWMSHEDYREQMAAGTLPELPLSILQFSIKLWGVMFILKLALLAIVVERCHTKFWRKLLYFWLTCEVLLSVLRMGSRTEIVLLLLATGLFYHRMVKPLRPWVVVVAGISILACFLVYGFVRDYSLATSTSGTNLGTATNEFQALLATAYDTYRLKQGGYVQIDWQVYFNDVVALLPPQQLLPFEKFDASEWYLRTIGQSGRGVGFMWGVIAQSVVGLDWIELFLRGAGLGYILARVHRWYLTRQNEFFATLFYVWLCLDVYYTFRDTTLSPLVSIVYEIIPAFLLMKYFPAFLKPKTKR